MFRQQGNQDFGTCIFGQNSLDRMVKIESFLVFLEGRNINPSVPDAPNWRISDFKKRLRETETS